MHTNLSNTSSALLVQAKLIEMVANLSAVDPAIIEAEIEEYIEEHGISGGGPVTGFLYERQGIVAATWIIDHNLNKFPQVTLIGEDNFKMDADISYSSLNQVTVTFAEPTAGMAVLI